MKLWGQWKRGGVEVEVVKVVLQGEHQAGTTEVGVCGTCTSAFYTLHTDFNGGPLRGKLQIIGKREFRVYLCVIICRC